LTGPYKLVNGPLTPQYNNVATLFEDDDGQTYLYCSGNGLFQVKIDLPSSKIIGSFEKFFDRKDHGNPDWMVGGIEGPDGKLWSSCHYIMYEKKSLSLLS
jgi:xylan 1,4-beta-xylosidase